MSLGVYVMPLATSSGTLRGHVWGLLYPLWVALAQNIDIYGTWGLTLTPFWRPRATIHRYLRWISAWAKTCTSKNGKRVTEGAYSFAWDKERAGEGVREDETRSQRKNNNALPDSFLYESLEAREQDGITAGEPESMSA